MSKNVLGKKMKALLLFFFLLGTICLPSALSRSISREYYQEGKREVVLYVGGSGPGNFSTIQQAIDNASDGDTVFVYNDSSPYSGEIIIDKMITLVGENKETTILDGNNTNLNDLVLITSDHVCLCNFTFQHSRSYPKLLHVVSNACKITSTILGPSQGDIVLQESQGHYIANNTIIDTGLNLISSHNTTLMYNDFSPTLYGALTIYGNNNIIRANKIEDEVGSGGSMYFEGISLNGEHNVIEDNTIICHAEKKYNGIRIGAPANIITGNTLLDCGFYFPKGYLENSFEENLINGKPPSILIGETNTIVEEAGQVLLFSCDHITIKNCAISGLYHGILIDSSPSCVCTGNTIEHCYVGINIDKSKDTELSGNYITSSHYGISLSFSPRSKVLSNVIEHTEKLGAAVSLASSHVTVKKNFIKNNSRGVMITGIRNIFINNEFSNNSAAIELTCGCGNVFRKNNFFDSDIYVFFTFSAMNFWFRNYWHRPRVLPKVIPGILVMFYIGQYPHGKDVIIPWCNIDFFPAKRPFPL
jgi:parallel beta-helix repeat protein